MREFINWFGWFSILDFDFVFEMKNCQNSNDYFFFHILQPYHLPLTESSKITTNQNNKAQQISALNEVVNTVSSPLWSTVNTAVAKNNDRRPNDIVTDYLLKQRQHIHEFSVTGTPKPATTNLNDVFITVKTTKLYHDTRLALIIKTWFQLAKDQVS